MNLRSNPMIVFVSSSLLQAKNQAFETLGGVGRVCIVFVQFCVIPDNVAQKASRVTLLIAVSALQSVSSIDACLLRHAGESGI